MAYKKFIKVFEKWNGDLDGKRDHFDPLGESWKIDVKSHDPYQDWKELTDKN